MSKFLFQFSRPAQVASLLLASVLFSACGGSGSGTSGGPKLIQLPKDRLAEIEKEKRAQERFELQKELLREEGHEIQFFDNDLFEADLGVRVMEHETVQLIYFNYADDIIGFCSGAWLDDELIATAGHCHSDEYRFDIRSGESCDGKVVFAYRSKASAATEYIRCNQTLETQFNVIWNEEVEQGSKNRLYDITDHAYFSVQPSPGLRSFNSQTLNNAELMLASHDGRSSTLGEDFYLLAVDPPSHYSDGLASEYDLVKGQRKEIGSSTRFYNLSVIDISYNGSQDGNSGGPVYFRFEDPELDPSQIQVGSGMAWAFPLYGKIFGNSKVRDGSLIGETISRIRFNLSYILQK